MFELVKSLHISSLILWLSAMLAAPVLLHVTKAHPERPVAERYYRITSGVGIALTWLFGIWLVSVTGYMNEPWMILKLALVLILSGMQGYFTAQFRMVARPTSSVESESILSTCNVYLLVLAQTMLITMIVILVTTKPI